MAGLLSLVTLIFCWADATQAATVGPLFDAPPQPTAHDETVRDEPVQDEVLLISTRAIGTVCNSESMNCGLCCQRLVTDPTGQQTWKSMDWLGLLSPPDERPMVVYVHGNRIAAGQDRAQGMQVYRSLKSHRRANEPVRYIIWSWPADQISGLIKDYRVKARRTNPAAWQLAWLLDKLPLETQLSLVGYSYGTRVVSGAAHLLAGGRIGNLQLAERVHPQRPLVRAALLAAAYDADWIQPGNFYSRTLAQIERLVLATNKLDPVMRFYHLSNGRGKMHALGKSGVHQPSALGSAVSALQRIDFTREVGRSHALVDYLAADGKMRVIWRRLTMPENPRLQFTTIKQPQVR